MEIQRDLEPSAQRRAETRIPKCAKYELLDGYRLVLERGDSDAIMVAPSSACRIKNATLPTREHLEKCRAVSRHRRNQ